MAASAGVVSWRVSASGPWSVSPAWTGDLTSVLSALLAQATCEPTGTIYTSDPLGLGVFALIGLFGGAHCLGMCGPLVSTYADRMRDDVRSTDDGRPAGRPAALTVGQVRQHALFNLGRTVSYATIGALFGLAGSLAFLTGRTVTSVADDVHAVTGIVVGTIIVVIGVRYALRLEFPRISVPGLDGLFQAVTARLVPRIDAWVSDWRIVGLGAAHGLLPCPLLYPAFLYAFVQGSVAGGAVTLGALGVGTIPAMFLFGTLFQSVSTARRRQLHRVLGVAFVALGYVPLQHGLAVLGVPLPHPPIPYYSPF